MGLLGVTGSVCLQIGQIGFKSGCIFHTLAEVCESSTFSVSLTALGFVSFLFSNLKGDVDVSL